MKYSYFDKAVNRLYGQKIISSKHWFSSYVREFEGKRSIECDGESDRECDGRRGEESGGGSSGVRCEKSGTGYSTTVEQTGVNEECPESMQNVFGGGESNIPEYESVMRTSRKVEAAIDRCLESGKYTFHNMLIIENPYKYAPLCAMALFVTPKEYRVRVKVKGKTSDTDIVYSIPASKAHRIPIMGLYGDRKNYIKIELVNDRNKVVKCKHVVLIPEPLSDRSSARKIVREKYDSGYLYDLTLIYGGDDKVYPVAFDRNGDVRFIFGMVPKTYGFQPISGGRMLFSGHKATRATSTNPASVKFLEVDQMGRCYREYNIEKGTHHDYCELYDGNIVCASNSFEGNTYEDTIIEIDRATGCIVNEVNFKDYMDKKFVDSVDWAHINTVEYDKDKKTVMVCMRNCHAVIKVNYEKKEVLWVLGNPEFFKDSSLENKVLRPIGDMEWFFQAHSAYFLKEKLDNKRDTHQLIIYDNHIHNRRPVNYFDGKKNSYVRIYTINEKERTVSLLKSYELPLSTVRSLGKYEDVNKRVYCMSGNIKVKGIDYKGSVVEVDYETGEELTKFTTNHGFYRAYGYELCPTAMSLAKCEGDNYILGNLPSPKLCDRINTEQAHIVLPPVLEEGDSDEESRTARIKKLLKDNPDYEVDYEQDIARIEMYIEENVLYVSMIDHLLEKIYLVGNNNTYCMDYTGTSQERPEYFARALNREPIPLGNLTKDFYRIYYKHKKGLYDSGKDIII
ncbi:MAG: hypothetical protein E7265_10730 [Lachnospiraceae bacterium]|nr:hypothetical protein [Lachnospiraceae bacterium]